MFCIFLREERPASDFEDSSTHWAAVFHVSRPWLPNLQLGAQILFAILMASDSRSR